MPCSWEPHCHEAVNGSTSLTGQKTMATAMKLCRLLQHLAETTSMFGLSCRGAVLGPESHLACSLSASKVLNGPSLALPPHLSPCLPGNQESTHCTDKVWILRLVYIMQIERNVRNFAGFILVLLVRRRRRDKKLGTALMQTLWPAQSSMPSFKFK